MLQIGAFAQKRAIKGMRLGAPKLQNAVANFAYRLHNRGSAWGNGDQNNAIAGN
jgi:hypothetical protein